MGGEAVASAPLPAAVAPPIMGMISDMLGVEESIGLIGWVALVTVPLAFILARQAAELKQIRQNV